MIYMPEREWQSREEQLYCSSVFNRPVCFRNSPGIMVWWSLGAATGSGFIRVEARSVLACGSRAGMWDWWMMGVKETRKEGWQTGLLKAGCSARAARLCLSDLELNLSNCIWSQCQTVTSYWWSKDAPISWCQYWVIRHSALTMLFSLWIYKFKSVRGQIDNYSHSYFGSMIYNREKQLIHTGDKLRWWTDC